MNYNSRCRTFDCDPTLTDPQVLEFCREGHLLLRGVVPDEINRRTCDYLEGKIPAQPSYIPEGLYAADLERIRNSHEPSTILLEDWFIEHVLLNLELTSIMRSLLGANVGLPVLVSHHRTECPMDAQAWHHDADHVFGPDLNFLEVFYFPQDTPPELGPTEIVPGSHFTRTQRDPEEAGILADGPAGTLGIHHQSILHRRGKSAATGMRHMLKYNYWRTVAPRRDWLADPDFDPATAYYGGHNVARYTAHMFWWLSGKGNDYRIIGGQGWPWRTENQIGPSYGYGATQGYMPDWRKTNPDGYTL
ncbi:MAG: phytanoyl-CoA dioxygenase family protein [Candidatus Latescibacterota bacterium]|nr:phytanoyl-CoA dioxygenase family protein [Candidatus Latescibacterota bacterium]